VRNEAEGRVPAALLPWLVDALTRDRRQLWTELAVLPEGVETAALHHGVEGWVLRRAHEHQVATPVLESAVAGAVARHQRALADLSDIDGVLAPRDLPFLVVKGPVLAALHGPPGLRSYVDLDILVRPEDVESAVLALEAAGFRLLDRNWALLHREDVHELRLQSPVGGPVDLHWSLGRGPWRNDHSPSFQLLDERGRWLRLGETRARVMGAEDTAIHTAVHAAAAGGHRLLWCADFRAALVEVESADELARLAQQWGAAPALDLMLHRTRNTLGPTVPSRRPAEFSGSPAWAFALGFTEKVSPAMTTGTHASLARALARSCRGTPQSSFIALAGKAAGWFAQPANRAPAERADLDPRSAQSALHPVGGEDAKARFLRGIPGKPGRAHRQGADIVVPTRGRATT
jgi:hypothetical protein